MVIHGLFWLARMLAGDGTDATSERPLALIVDDVDRADEPSLRFLAYLAPRVGDLPIAVVVAARPVPSSADPSALCGDPPVVSALRGTSELILLAPVPPSLSAVADAPSRASRPELVEIPAVGGAGAVAAQMALRRSLAGGHRESVIDLAELAWGDGALLESDEDAPAWASAAEALLCVDELERAIEIAEAANRVGVAAEGLPAGAHHCHGWSLYHQGRITAALAVAEAALAAQPDSPAARGLLAACALAQGRLDDAEEALSVLGDGESIDDTWTPMLLDMRAQLRLVQLRPTDAQADALKAGRAQTGRGEFWALASWRGVRPRHWRHWRSATRGGRVRWRRRNSSWRGSEGCGAWSCATCASWRSPPRRRAHSSCSPKRSGSVERVLRGSST